MTPQPLNRPCGVDVLEQLAKWANEKGIGRDEWNARSATVAAVAELIEAVAEKFAADDDKHVKGFRTIGMDLRSMNADTRLRAALAAVEGQP